VGFVEDLERVGTGLEAATASYQEAHKKLATGKGNVVRQAEMLKEFGLKPKKNLPVGIVESASQEELELSPEEVEDESVKKRALGAGE